MLVAVALVAAAIVIMISCKPKAIDIAREMGVSLACLLHSSLLTLDRAGFQLVDKLPTWRCWSISISDSHRDGTNNTPWPFWALGTAGVKQFLGRLEAVSLHFAWLC